MARRNWMRNELLLAFNLYCRLRFGQCHSRNPQIIDLANQIGRSPGSVAMKLVNFASLDPTHSNRGVSGLRNASQSDRLIWDEFNSDWERLAIESEQILLGQRQAADLLEENEHASSTDDFGLMTLESPTEAEQLVRVRLGQAFFRKTVLASYDWKCCICGIPCRELLVASHIIPWATREDIRVDPRNGLCLCATHDKAFDRGLISIDGLLRVVISPRLKSFFSHPLMQSLFADYAFTRIASPEKFAPHPEYCSYHFGSIFIS